MNFSEYIKYRRKSLGYSQNQLADYLLISKQAVYKWEKRLSFPDILLIPKLAAFLEIDPNLLTKMIWCDSHEETYTHFLLLNVTEKDGVDYIVKVFESDDFLQLADLLEEIRKGVNNSALQLLSEYYNCDNTRTFQIVFEVCEYEMLDDPDSSHILIDTFDITSVVADCCNHSTNLN